MTEHNPSRKAAPKGTSRASFIMLWTVATVAVAAAFIVHLGMRFETIERGYEVGTARREQRELIEECRNLRLEAATYRRIERVESIARGTLHMELPTADRIVPIVSEDEGRETAGRVR